MKIVWTDSAKSDLMDIRDFLKNSESLQFAIKITKEIRDEVATLEDGHETWHTTRYGMDAGISRAVLGRSGICPQFGAGINLAQNTT